MRIGCQANHLRQLALSLGLNLILRSFVRFVDQRTEESHEGNRRDQMELVRRNRSLRNHMHKYKQAPLEVE